MSQDNVGDDLAENKVNKCWTVGQVWCCIFSALLTGIKDLDQELILGNKYNIVCVRKLRNYRRWAGVTC